MVETRERAVIDAEEAAESERRLARYAALGIPTLSIGVAAVIGALLGLGPAILALIGGALLGAITLFWASLRTLSGDAPLPTDLEAMVFRTGAVDDLAERKRRVLRALKDLELEHSVGKIDDKDYAALDAKLRAEAKTVLREMDDRVEPLRGEAERVAQRYLAKKGLGRVVEAAGQDTDATTPTSSTSATTNAAAAARVACAACETSNEPDAAFCKKCGAPLHAPKTKECADASS